MYDYILNKINKLINMREVTGHGEGYHR